MPLVSSSRVTEPLNESSETKDEKTVALPRRIIGEVNAAQEATEDRIRRDRLRLVDDLLFDRRQPLRRRDDLRDAERRFAELNGFVIDGKDEKNWTLAVKSLIARPVNTGSSTIPSGSSMSTNTSSGPRLDKAAGS